MNEVTKKYEAQCAYCGMSYSHSLNCKLDKIEILLSDAMDCLKGETPEDISKAEAKRQIIDRIRLWLIFGEI